MPDIMIRVEAEDYDAWLKTHYDHVEDRHSYGMTNGPVYRDIDNPNAALFHIHVENLDRAMQWFRTDTFKEASMRATVVGRDSTWPRSNNLALRPSPCPPQAFLCADPTRTHEPATQATVKVPGVADLGAAGQSWHVIWPAAFTARAPERPR